MAIAKYVWLVCNKCPNHYKGAEGMTSRGVRAQAKESGWTSTRKTDFCPDCSAQIQEAIKNAKAGNI